MFLERHMALRLQRLVQRNAPVLVQGPRGAGKSTLVRRELPQYLWVDLAESRERARARQDPAAFLARLRRAAVIDEVQRAPELVEYLRTEAGEWPLVLVSDLRLELPMEICEVQPPTRAERQRRPAMPLELLGRFVPAEVPLRGEAAEWPRRRDFLERDVPLLLQLEERDRFERLCERVEEQSGSLLVQQDLARELGVSHRTVVRWLRVLEDCFLTLRLEALGEDFGRRLVRRPKLHWLGAKGNFETEAVTELYRNAVHAGRNCGWHYWRDSNGLEVPLVIEEEGVWMPVALAEQPNPAAEAQLQRWMQLADVNQGAMIGRRAALRERKGSRVLRYVLGQL